MTPIFNIFSRAGLQGNVIKRMQIAELDTFVTVALWSNVAIQMDIQKVT